jgi:hypothetical protein
MDVRRTMDPRRTGRVNVILSRETKTGDEAGCCEAKQLHSISGASAYDA